MNKDVNDKVDLITNKTLHDSQVLSKVTAEGSMAVLRQIAMSDALNQTRSLAALKESAIGSMINEIPKMNVRDRLELMEKINCSSSIDSYTHLLEKTTEKTKHEIEDDIEIAKKELELIRKQKELELREMELIAKEKELNDAKEKDSNITTVKRKGRPPKA